MKTRILALTLALAPLTVSCSVSGVFRKGGGGPESVDDLLSRIEHVEAQAELAQARMRTSIGALHGLLATDFDGDPLGAYAAFLTEIDASEQRAKELRTSVAAMKSAAGPFFSAWSARMNSFTNPELRARSQDRMLATQDRYQSILSAVEPALADHAALNAGLRDQALFLEHDFNAESVAELQRDARTLTKLASMLDQRLTTTKNASRQYVETTALHGQLAIVSTADTTPGD